MPIDGARALEAFAAQGVATFLTRVFPFLLPRRLRGNPHLRYLERRLPPAVMLLLVVYCLKGTRLTAAPYGIPELLAVALVVGLHLWRRNALLSIGAGTAFYAALLQYGLVEKLLGGG